MAGALALWLAGCGPGARVSEDIPSTITQICRTEYRTAVEMRWLDRTLTLYAPSVKDLITFERGEPRFGQSLSNLVLAIHRVVLGHPQAPEFYVVVARDAELPIEITMIRDLEDVKKDSVNAFPVTESQLRTILHTRELSADEPRPAVLSLPVTLKDFLAWQLAQRLEVSLSSAGAAPHVAGEFTEGRFRLVLEFEPTSPMTAPVPAIEHWLAEIPALLHSYRFTDFDRLELLTLPQGKVERWPAAQFLP